MCRTLVSPRRLKFGPEEPRVGNPGPVVSQALTDGHLLIRESSGLSIQHQVNTYWTSLLAAHSGEKYRSRTELSPSRTRSPPEMSRKRSRRHSIFRADWRHYQSDSESPAPSSRQRTPSRPLELSVSAICPHQHPYSSGSDSGDEMFEQTGQTTSYTRAIPPHLQPTTPSTSAYEVQAEGYDQGDYDDYDLVPQRPHGPMVPIAIGSSDAAGVLVPYQPPNRDYTRGSLLDNSSDPLSLGTRAQIPTGHILNTLRAQATCDSNVPSDQMLGTF